MLFYKLRKRSERDTVELLKTEMTPKERTMAYMRGEEVDRIPTSLSASETAPPLYGVPIR